MSSPNVNNLIALGVMLAYLCVALMGFDSSMVDHQALLVICTVKIGIFIYFYFDHFFSIVNPVPYPKRIYCRLQL